MYAHDAILVGTSSIVVAGGMESMTNAPYLLSKAHDFGHTITLPEAAPSMVPSASGT